MTTINQATNINTNTLPSTPRRKAFLGDLGDFIKLLTNNNIKPDFKSITIGTFTDERGKSRPSLTFYRVDGKDLSEEKFNAIRKLVSNRKLRSYNGAQEKDQYAEETLYADQVTDSATIAKINHILRNS